MLCTGGTFFFALTPPLPRPLPPLPPSSRILSLASTYILNHFYVPSQSFLYTFPTNTLNDLYKSLKGFIRVIKTIYTNH